MSPARALLALLTLVLFTLASHAAVAHHWLGAWLFYLLPVLVNLALCVVFAASLRRERDPLISRFARMEQATLTPELARYTRTLTAIWCGFFLLMAALSASLALWASFALWALFTNLVNYLLIAVLLLGEYGYRLRRFPHYRHAPPWQVLRNIGRCGLR
jgi:uncharacterized membrane protein